MKEYLILFEGVWLRFFLNPRLGLCVSRMENSKFSKSETLLLNAKSDFAAVLVQNAVHIVCQNEKGGIIHLIYDGKTLKKSVLLESRENRPYTKYFTLIPIGAFINLFYVIKHEGKEMLIHKILSENILSPEVVDYVEPSGIRFFAYPGISTDISAYDTVVVSVSTTTVSVWVVFSISAVIDASVLVVVIIFVL